MTDSLRQHQISRRYQAGQVVFDLLMWFERGEGVVHDVPDDFRRLLTEQEQMLLAWALLRSLPFDRSLDVAQAVLSTHGYPVAPLAEEPKEIMRQARVWADMATEQEIRAYAMVCVEKMSGQRRSGFFAWLRKKFGGANG